MICCPAPQPLQKESLYNPSSSTPLHRDGRQFGQVAVVSLTVHRSYRRRFILPNIFACRASNWSSNGSCSECSEVGRSIGRPAEIEVLGRRSKLDILFGLIWRKGIPKCFCIQTERRQARQHAASASDCSAGEQNHCSTFVRLVAASHDRLQRRMQKAVQTLASIPFSRTDFRLGYAPASNGEVGKLP
ncbi:hypothetical protein CERZMDRAFT_101570 [Cercospora zeae-maydis SCOH1-5]|uniref:Uncharacterized protein n=1 Tax=Cercospora zeae-maydis SCOH1-5 TaxID=717836 RepID=A0A6A6F4U0_9PEZI|nr:hypothetical protein CERZMDRAFT_101570 [Cercospora zeae-maydis SCOH1-5]